MEREQAEEQEWQDILARAETLRRLSRRPRDGRGQRFEHGSILGGKTRANRASSQAFLADFP